MAISPIHKTLDIRRCAINLLSDSRDLGKVMIELFRGIISRYLNILC
ncbi:hypothetical protein PL11201_460009 [Planktothrix sp. PCC 11201]|nr:hypothetical protein PL11201_460009 [Planktothrix sp. PCC 11201]